MRPRAVQHARLMQRDCIEVFLADRMIAAQANRTQRQALADDVVVNHGHPDDLQVQVEPLHARYMRMAPALTHHAHQYPHQLKNACSTTCT